jgi:hypothetical protein
MERMTAERMKAAMTTMTTTRSADVLYQHRNWNSSRNTYFYYVRKVFSLAETSRSGRLAVSARVDKLLRLPSHRVGLNNARAV